MRSPPIDKRSTSSGFGEVPNDPRGRFARATGVPEDQVDLCEAALWIAAEEYPSLDVVAYQGRLDRLARSADGPVRAAGDDAERVAALIRHLHEEEGFTGNRENYDDPRNSFLNEVLDRRMGIPITLSLVYMAVGRRLDLPVQGIGFPGHFLVKYVGKPEIVFDPFVGVVLTEEQCQTRLQAALGSRARLRPEHLRPATPHESLARLLRNLKHLYLRGADTRRALAACDRILMLMPDAPLDLRDRGLVLEQMECFGPAVADLERFLQLAPEDESAGAVRTRLGPLRERARRLH